MTARPAVRRAATASMSLLALSAGFVVTGPAASAGTTSCGTSGSHDVVDPSIDRYVDLPAADIREMCVSHDGTTLLLTATVAPGTPPMTDRAALGSTTLRWEVATTTADGAKRPFVVVARPDGATVQTADSYAQAGAALCSSTDPMADPAGFRTAFPVSCFPGAVTFEAAPLLSFDADASDPASTIYLHGNSWTTTGRIDNGLSTVDRRYLELGGDESPLGRPVAVLERGVAGTTERRRYEHGIITYSPDVDGLARAVFGPLHAKYALLREEAGPLGRPLHDSPGLRGSQRFERGSLVSTESHGVSALYGPIDQLYSRDFGVQSHYLGLPVTDERTTSDGVGRYNHFEQGSIYWTPVTGARAVAGDIHALWSRLGWERSALGYPTTSRVDLHPSDVSYNDFQAGSIYSSPATGAHEVRGAIHGTWDRLGRQRSALGLPTTDELGTPVARGRFNHFQHGSVYWTPTTGAREVRGAIRSTWAARGWELGAVGYPVTDELGTPDGRGRFNHFEHGSVYWTPTSGAHEVRGAIRDRWASVTRRPTYSPGWERGPLGYPITSELATPDGVGRFNHFERGSIYWRPGSSSAKVVYGGIRDYWASTGWEAGPLGYPLDEEGDNPGGRAQRFENGILFWDAATGKVSRR